MLLLSFFVEFVCSPLVHVCARDAPPFIFLLHLICYELSLPPLSVAFFGPPFFLKPPLGIVGRL